MLLLCVETGGLDVAVRGGSGSHPGAAGVSHAGHFQGFKSGGLRGAEAQTQQKQDCCVLEDCGTTQQRLGMQAQPARVNPWVRVQSSWGQNQGLRGPEPKRVWLDLDPGSLCPSTVDLRRRDHPARVKWTKFREPQPNQNPVCHLGAASMSNNNPEVWQVG